MSMPVPTHLPSGASVPPAGPPLRWLWAAVGVLGIAVLALGGTLLVQQRSPVVAAPAPAVAAPRTPESEIIEERWAPAPAGGVARTPAPTARPAARPVPLQPLADAAPARPVARVAQGERAAPCAVCGRVESVQAVQQSAPATGVGAVAGGVLGAVVGNQVGKGSGRTAATVLGAVGGGYVGHRVEQNTRTQTVYHVRVRMQDGSVRQFQRSQPVAVGEPVIVQGRGFHTDPAALQPMPPSPVLAAQPG